jgi:hypothetical protein
MCTYKFILQLWAIVLDFKEFKNHVVIIKNIIKYLTILCRFYP